MNVKSFCEVKKSSKIIINSEKLSNYCNLKAFSPLFTTFPWVRVGNMISQLFVAVGSERK